MFWEGRCCYFQKFLAVTRLFSTARPKNPHSHPGKPQVSEDNYVISRCSSAITVFSVGMWEVTLVDSQDLLLALCLRSFSLLNFLFDPSIYYSLSLCFSPCPFPQNRFLHSFYYFLVSLGEGGFDLFFTCLSLPLPQAEREKQIHFH